MARPRTHRVRLNVGINRDTFAELETLLIDPVKGRLLYGALSNITNRLYRQWLDNLHKPGVDVVKYLEAYGVNLHDEAQNVNEEDDDDGNA